MYPIGWYIALHEYLLDDLLQGVRLELLFFYVHQKGRRDDLRQNATWVPCGVILRHVMVHSNESRGELWYIQGIFCEPDQAPEGLRYGFQGLVYCDERGYLRDAPIRPLAPMA